MKALLLIAISAMLTAPLTGFSQTNPTPDKCQKVQALLNVLRDIKGPQIKGNSYQCKDDFIITGFQTCAIQLEQQGDKIANWKVTMQADAMPREPADSIYLALAHDLVRCIYLNSWKVTEETGDQVYYFKINQTISSDDRFKNITLTLARVPKTDKWKLEMALAN